MLTYTAFEESKIISHGSLEKVALEVRRRLKVQPEARILIFSDSSGKQMDLDLRGSERDTLERLKVYIAADSPQSTGPGRPKLGVVAREISLLPRHWEWLSNQSGGASATIRRLVDEKMKEGLSARDKVKKSQEAAYKFLSAIAGNLPDYEEAIRYLYRRDGKRFRQLSAKWPGDLASHAFHLAAEVFSPESK